MKLRLLTGPELYTFLRETVPGSCVRVYVYTLSNHYLPLLLQARRECSIAVVDPARRTTREAAQHLAKAGFNVYTHRNLHMKLIIINQYQHIIIGSANLTKRSTTQNIELNIAITNPPTNITTKLATIEKTIHQKMQPLHKKHHPHP